MKPLLARATTSRLISSNQSGKGWRNLSKHLSPARRAPPPSPIFTTRHNTIEDLIAEGDKVVARLTYRGTHQGELFGQPPTGGKIERAGLAIFTIKAGKIAEVWVLGDLRGLWRQLAGS